MNYEVLIFCAEVTTAYNPRVFGSHYFVAASELSMTTIDTVLADRNLHTQMTEDLSVTLTANK